jgi:hypothetical protein
MHAALKLLREELFLFAHIMHVQIWPSNNHRFKSALMERDSQIWPTTEIPPQVRAPFTWSNLGGLLISVSLSS